MSHGIVESTITGKEVPLRLLTQQALSGLPPKTQAWAALCGFDATPGSFMAAEDVDQNQPGFLIGAPPQGDRWLWAKLCESLPSNATYRLLDALSPFSATEACIGWSLGTYQFGIRKAQAKVFPNLLAPANADLKTVKRVVHAVTLGRDLINQPGNLLGPQELAATVAELAAAHNANIHVLSGKRLAEQNFPLIHTVGGSSHREPCLIDMTWGDEAHPAVTLVGKGVCFDTGGLNLKAMIDMRNMKRDMGGAAVMIALASMIMDAQLPVRLRLLIPAVDNFVAADAFRPGDILTARNGLTVEVANTDCEGRLVLADALAYASEGRPDLIIDAGTLTGAARMAFGGEIGAMFCSDEAVGLTLQNTARKVDDPLWMMPLWAAYRQRIMAPVGNLLNMADGSFAGAITAALFLKEFVSASSLWIHLDITAWNDRVRPGRPSGGETIGMHALFQFLIDRYSRQNATIE